MTRLLGHLPPAPAAELAQSPDLLLDGFVDFVAEEGISLYPAQEEAILELLAGQHVILNTPTGSGKTLVAAAAHFAALATDRRSVYTAPIKALVSEKFFALCRDFGSERVGMITGDARVNPDAPIICCTAEILANWALRDGAQADVDMVIVDEFHFYADPQRGWAWQVPLLELPQCQFLLMSATIGQPGFFQRDLTRRTGRPTALVQSSDRPVPLDFDYRRTTLHNSIDELLTTGQAPIYLVHFTQREATEAAQGYLSLDPLTKDEKAAVKSAIGGFRFDTPIGKDLRRYLHGGVGVHHAGMLPKYRLLVEKLAQDGLLKIICGTDTLGVGVNVPIRSVLFTQLCKYDGSTTRLLSIREFQQIAGRAGRKGFDDRGTVWVQAPAHVVENLRTEEKEQAKAATSGKRARKTVKRKPPERGYAHWTEDTYQKLITGDPEPLRSSFAVSHQMMMNLLDRPVGLDGLDGCAATRRLLTDNHEPRRRQRRHIRRSIAIYRSLVAADLLEFPSEPDELGRRVRVNFDLQDEFALNQPLSLWAVEAISEIAAPEPGLELVHALDVLTVLEAVQETPGPVVAAQVNLAKAELVADLKARGIEYDERMERLAEVEPPQPNKDWLYQSFDRFRDEHPWVGGDNVKPKSIVRDLLEQAMTFSEFVNHYGLKRSEGVVLRYLSDVFRALNQNVPDDAKTDELDDIAQWLGVQIRSVDSSLIDEWERLQHPDEPDIGETARGQQDEVDIVSNRRAFAVMVRNKMFRWVENLAFRRQYAELNQAAAPTSGLGSLDAIIEAMAPYWEEHGEIGVGGGARSAELFLFDHQSGRVTQILDDPSGNHDWRLEATVDLEASREQATAVIILDRLGPI